MDIYSFSKVSVPVASSATAAFKALRNLQEVRIMNVRNGLLHMHVVDPLTAECLRVEASDAVSLLRLLCKPIVPRFTAKKGKLTGDKYLVRDALLKDELTEGVPAFIKRVNQTEYHAWQVGKTIQMQSVCGKYVFTLNNSPFEPRELPSFMLREFPLPFKIVALS